MALSASTVWEVRTTGNDTNGGGFVTGSSGTDWSQANSPQYALTNGHTQGTAVILTASAAADMVGNIAYVQGGTGSVVAAWYQITAASVGVSITVDRSTGLTSGTGATINVGGALATISQMIVNRTVGGQNAYVKATGTYSISTGLTDNTASDTTNRSRVVGYSSTRGDGGQATIQATAAITMLAISVAGHSWENFIFDGNSATASAGVTTSERTTLFNCLVKNVTGIGISISVDPAYIVLCEVSGCGTTAGIQTLAYAIIDGCYVHDNTVSGMSLNPGSGTFFGSVTNTILANNTGATSDGISIPNRAYGCVIACTIYGNGRSGITISGGTEGAIFPTIRGNIFYTNASYGLDAGLTSTFYAADCLYNAYGGGTQVARNGIAAGLGDVTLTGNPFIGSPNFALNNTSGAGASCRAASSLGTFPGGHTVGYLDIGAAQHQDSPSTTNLFIIEG